MNITQADTRDAKVLMIHMSQAEALMTIHALARQLAALNGHPGVYEVYEKFTDEGWDFSIRVGSRP